MCLKQLTQNIFAAYEARIPIHVRIYSAETPPNRLEVNLTGGELLQGKTKSLLCYDVKEGVHMAHFKLKINEVTSRMQNGWVFLAVMADVGRIRPLIVERLIIMAKERLCQKWRQMH